MKYIIIKADDYGVEFLNYQCRWERFISLILKRNIKANLGINSIQLDNYDKESLLTKIRYKIKSILKRDRNNKIWKQIKKIIDTGNFELFNHSYEHVSFKNIEDKNKIHYLINKNQEIVKKKTGYSMIAFGDPYLSCSDLLIEYLESQKDIPIYITNFNGNINMPLVLKYEVWVENYTIFPPLPRVSFEYFLCYYNSIINKTSNDYIVINIHPWGYDDESKFSELEKIIDFLLEEKHTFVTLSEYLTICKSKENKYAFGENNANFDNHNANL
jgi:peptidoglycan/xylan/chitin deacetylase (PgdA/CDA1 family)